MPTVRLFAGMREKMETREIAIPARDVRGLLDDLALRKAGALASVLFDDPASEARVPHQDLRVLVNGRSTSCLDGLDTARDDDDTVTLMLHGARGYPGG